MQQRDSFGDNYSSMKGSSFSLNKIYGQCKVQTLKRRIDFIASRRKKNWISIEHHNDNGLQQGHPTSKVYKNASQFTAKNEDSSRTAHSKTRSVELMDLKTKRYQECKQNSERIFKRIQLQRLDEIQTKRLKRMRIVYDEQQAKERLYNYELERIRNLQQSHVKSGVDEAVAMKTVELKQSLLREEGQELRHYEEELSYRSEVMRKIKQMIEKTNEHS